MYLHHKTQSNLQLSSFLFLEENFGFRIKTPNIIYPRRKKKTMKFKTFLKLNYFVVRSCLNYLFTGYKKIIFLEAKIYA